ncbi:MAG TPA: hypothetical protein VFW96_08650 [Thermomicrobiales bacterium]|nr:hypothetical protein [Thermomicrobiales bacterium]
MSPAVVLTLSLGSIYGLLCHAFVGRRWRQLPLYWAVGVAGFLAGYVVAVVSGLDVVRLGAVPLLATTLGSLAALAATAWLARKKEEV